VDEGQFLTGCGAGQHRLSFELEVGVEGAAGVDAERKAAGPAVDAAELPATNDGIGETIPGVSKTAAAAEREIVNPVGVDLMAGVEVRGPA